MPCWILNFIIENYYRNFNYLMRLNWPCLTSITIMIMSKCIIAGHMYDLEMSKNMYRGLSIFTTEKSWRMKFIGIILYFPQFFSIYCKYWYSDTEISWIQSLIVIFWMMIGAPISKQIIPKIGYRWTLWIGGFLMMIGAVLSSMVTSIYFLYGTMGVIFGMGVGLCYLPHLLVAGEYFNEQRNNAFAIISSGNFSTYL